MRTHGQTILLFLAICACGNLAQAGAFSHLQSPLAGGANFPSWPSGNQRADNVSFLQKTKVTTVRWWGAYVSNPPSGSDSFTVRFFAPDPMAGNAPLPNPSNQFTSLAITRSNSGLVDNYGEPIYQYEAQLSTPVIFSAGALAYFSVLNGSSSSWLWQRSSNAGTNWFRLNEPPESWFLAPDADNRGNLAFHLIGVTQPLGDYNSDFAVTETDYNLWRQNFGSVNHPAVDGNLNGVVDAADYVLWRKNLGTAVGSSGGFLATVPEPSLCVITLTSFLLLGLVIRARTWSVARRRNVIAMPGSI